MYIKEVTQKYLDYMETHVRMRKDRKKCFYCKGKFKIGDIIVVFRRSKQRTKRYHKDCYEATLIA